MFGLLIVYIVFCIRKSRSENADVISEFDREYTTEVNGLRGIIQQLAFVLSGLVLLGIGSNLLVEGAVRISTWLGVSELVIGLTVIAIGTSLPEGVTSIVASLRGQRDIAVGNVVGSNLFNILCVLGLTAVVSPKPVSISQDALDFDIPVMVAVTIICLPIFLTGSVVRRWEGGLFVVYYVAYTTFICLAASGLVDRDPGSPIMYGVVPLTLFAFAISFYQGVRPKESVSSDDTAN